MPSQVVALPHRRVPMPERQTREGTAVWVAVVVAAVAALGLWSWSGSSKRRALESLGADERHSLFLRTEDTVRTVCANPPRAMSRYCEDQAEFLLEFPECDKPCGALVHERLARVRPTR